MSKEVVKKKMSSKEFFDGLVRQFQSESGIAMGNLNSLYNAQLQDIVTNFANMQAQLNASNNKAIELAAEIVTLKELLKSAQISIPEPKQNNSNT